MGGPDTNDDIDDALRGGGGNHQNNDVLTLQGEIRVWDLKEYPVLRLSVCIAALLLSKQNAKFLPLLVSLAPPCWYSD